MDRIGRGAMAEVWSARDLETGAEVAVKLAHSWASAEPELLERFAREAKVLRRLRSPFICSFVASGHTQDGRPYLVLERLVGETLEDLLAREGWLAMEEVAKIAEEVLQALAVAHAAGVVHRDLSPSNIFLHRHPDGTAVTKVLDFGIAKYRTGTGPSTGKQTMMGSLPFAAPEQLGDSGRAGPPADIYALGAVVFKTLTGRHPFGDARDVALIVLKREHEPPTIDEATGEKWPAALKTFLAKAMSRLPSQRHASAEIALAELREALRGRGPMLEGPEPSLDATTTMDDSDDGGRY